MPKYIKKPVTVDAIQWDNTDDASRRKIMDWMVTNKASFEYNGESGELSIVTLEGTMIVSHLDYVIKGIQDEFYPCKPDIFEASYVPKAS